MSSVYYCVVNKYILCILFSPRPVFSRALSLIFCQIKTHETKANILSQYSTSHLIVLDIWRYFLYILLEVTVSRGNQVKTSGQEWFIIWVLIYLYKSITMQCNRDRQIKLLTIWLTICWSSHRGQVNRTEYFVNISLHFGSFN